MSLYFKQVSVSEILVNNLHHPGLDQIICVSLYPCLGTSNILTLKCVVGAPCKQKELYRCINLKWAESRQH